jgi:hypothetical protein
MIKRNQSKSVLSTCTDDFNITPDWSMIGTVESIEKELQDFKFAGTGWYIFNDGKMGVDTVLILPFRRSERLFRVSVYNGRDPRDAFRNILDMPVRG